MLSGEIRDQLKQKAIILRKQGWSYPMIETELGVIRSTLSGWFKGLKLSTTAQEKILIRKRHHMARIRLLASASHRARGDRLRREVEKQVTNDFDSLPLGIKHKEALLAMLYLGEGFKMQSAVALGNSNWKILRSFVNLLRDIYQVPDERLRCFLYLRADQVVEKEVSFWSHSLAIPVSQFRKSQKDKRTIGKKTWKDYHGVCAVYCYDARIEKRLTAAQAWLLKNLMGL